jgi:hypothetical protein
MAGIVEGNLVFERLSTGLEASRLTSTTARLNISSLRLPGREVFHGPVTYARCRWKRSTGAARLLVSVAYRAFS